MPYIKANDGRRQALRAGDTALTAGELNYQIFFYVKRAPNGVISDFHKAVIKGFIVQFLGEHPNYDKYNSMTGCLIRCAFELERRLQINPDFLMDILVSYNEEINKYEDIKIKENSDVE